MRTSKVAFKIFEADLDYERSMNRFELGPFRRVNLQHRPLFREFVDLLKEFVEAQKQH